MEKDAYILSHLWKVWKEVVLPSVFPLQALLKERTQIETQEKGSHWWMKTRR